MFYEFDNFTGEEKKYKYSNEAGIMPYLYFYKLLARKPDGSE